jgi:hypothetical protein
MEKKPSAPAAFRRRLRLGDAAIGGSKQYNITIAPGLLRRPCDRLGVVVDIRVVKKDDTLSLRAPNAPTRYDNIRIAAIRKHRRAAGFVRAGGCAARLQLLVISRKGQNCGMASLYFGV